MTSVPIQRAVSASSPVGTPGRLPNLPVIEHPMSRLGDRNDLAVRGSATYAGGRKGDLTPRGLQRSNTDVGTRNREGGANDLRKSSPDRILNWPPAVELSPPFKYKEKPYEGILPEINPAAEDRGDIPDKVDKFPRVGQIPKLPPLPSISEQEEFLKGPGKPFIKSKEYNYQPRTTQELIELIREKFGTGYYGIRHLFKSNDPTGKGAVSREALQRILYTLCGYITPDQYTKLLRAMNLEGKTPIPFETFVQYFKDTEDKKNWVSALQTASLHSSETHVPEGYLRRGDMRVHDPYTSMPFSDAIFKEKCKSKHFDAHRVFPASVFETNGLILPPQLREAYATLGIYMTDDDFNKLWQRYDKEGTGALHTEHFFRLVGLDSQGRPRQTAPYTPRGAAYPKSKQRPHSEIGHTDGIDTSMELQKILKKEGVEEMPKTDRQRIEVPTAKEESDSAKEEIKPEEDTGRKIEIKKTPKASPKLDNIIDCLHYKFEESYQAMLTAFLLFDFLNDSYVSKIDFRRVLLEFGFFISPSELDHFLKKNGMRAIKGQLNYREFLNKFQSKSLNSIMARTAVDTTHPFHGEGSNGSTTLTADALEARLLDHFHGDFIKMLAHFRQCDKYNIGMATKHEFRAAIEKRLGYSMTEMQWEQLKATVGEDKDGLIPYTKFLEFFDITPGSWNFKQEGNIQVAQVPASEMPIPVQVERLKDRAKTEMIPPPPPPPDSAAGKIRSLEEDNRRKAKAIKTRIDELFKNRFHSFDKHFKAMDRRMTGRMSKWQFGALLKMCGLSLHPQELDRIWATLNVSTDGMYSYSTLIQHFINYKIPHEQKETVIFENMFNVDEAEEIWYDSSEDTKELVETARRIQRERREEQMKRDHLARQKARENNEEWKPELPTYPDKDSPRAVTASTTISHASVPSIPASRASFASVQSSRTKSLLVKIRTDVINNWEGLKSVFKYVDRNGSASIPVNEMREIMSSMQFSLDEDEKAELCKRFDSQKNGRFNYLQFMKCYAQRKNKENQPKAQIYSKFTHQLQAQTLIKGKHRRPTVQQVIEMMCEKLFREHRTLRRAFKKLDQGHKGYLNMKDFRKALKECNINFTNEDFYHLLTEFDQNMDGKISYELFLRTMLTV
ncbi:EF-hand calcium-binding domain-containing protein 6-like isoform X4 [Mercenaria mercenaria]|uniref:EF-hand calcium-binding domain-containing protein 6-like isoform X4 n=1 Tax=Mercenaria mercenaria TaxID=6596 RepID=UPI00234E9DB8|nr:EF-hand calcium-binding domain-containing protein 6-like isoform X4 [Mercenaria mercenaria]